MLPPMNALSNVSAPARTLLPWRLLALFYDLWPAMALWMLLSSGFTLGYTLAGHDPHENIPPFSLLMWLLWLCCWLLTGLYATVSWRRGGQTLGMRPWRLHLIASGDETPLPWRTLWLRYVVGSLSLLLAGLGFWWALLDRDRLTWHDRASGTRLQRQARPTRT